MKEFFTLTVRGGAVDSLKAASSRNPLKPAIHLRLERGEGAPAGFCCPSGDARERSDAGLVDLASGLESWSPYSEDGMGAAQRTRRHVGKKAV